MSEHGIVQGGFIKKRYDEIYDEIRTELLETLEIDISENPQGVLNVITGTYVDRLARLWDEAENLYYSAYPESATGVSLDNVCSLGGVERIPGTSTVYRINIKLNAGATRVIPRGTAASITINDTIHYASAISDTAVSPQNINKTVITCQASLGQMVTVRIDNAVYAYITATGNASTDNSALYSILSSQIALNTTLTCSLANNKITIAATDGQNHSVVLTNVSTVEYETAVLFRDQALGPFKYEGSEVQVSGVVSPFGSAYCYTYAEGTYAETDTELRQRYYERLNGRSSASQEAITTAIMNVEGVIGCNVIVNNADETVSSQPPHSVAPYIDVGTADLQEIGEAIYDTVAAGIPTYGSSTINLSGGRTVKYSLPSNIYTYVKITLTATDTLPSDYIQTCQDIFLSMAEGLSINEGLSLQAIAVKITESIASVVYTEIACNTDGGETYDMFYLPPVATSKYEFAEARITIVEA